MAEIEGLDYSILYKGFTFEHILINHKEYEGVYDPIENNTLCFNLIKKYKVDIEFGKEEVHANCFGKDFKLLLPAYAGHALLNNAVCLSIIKAYEKNKR